MSARVLVAVVLALVAIGGGWWFFTNFERVEEDVFVGMSGEARTNRLLAFERWLVAMGRETRPIRSIVELGALPERGALVIARNRQSLDESARERVRAWVEGGGSVVIEAERPGTDDALVDDWLGIERTAAKPSSGATRPMQVRLPGSAATVDVELPASQILERGSGAERAADTAGKDDDEDDTATDKPGADEAANDAEDDGKPPSNEAGKSTTKGSGSNTAKPAPAAPQSVPASEAKPAPAGVPAAAVRLADASGGRILGLDVGRGRALVYADFGPLVNNRIGNLRNAELTWALVRWGDGNGAPRGPVFVLTRPGKLSVWQWLRDNAFVVLVAGAALFLAWLGRSLARFGPVLPDPLPARRRIGDHLAASGRFLWRHGAIAPLAAATRARAMTGMERLAPGFSRMSPDEQITHIAKATGCTTDEARVLLATRASEAHALTATARLAQRVHAALANRNTKKPAGTATAPKG